MDSISLNQLKLELPKGQKGMQMAGKGKGKGEKSQLRINQLKCEIWKKKQGRLRKKPRKPPLFSSIIMCFMVAPCSTYLKLVSALIETGCGSEIQIHHHVKADANSHSEIHPRKGGRHSHSEILASRQLKSGSQFGISIRKNVTPPNAQIMWAFF